MFKWSFFPIAFIFAIIFSAKSDQPQQAEPQAKVSSLHKIEHRVDAKNNRHHITHPGATFIKFKLSQLRLGKKDSIVIRSPKTKERYVYTQEQLNNKKDTSLISISGDSAIIELISLGKDKFASSAFELSGYWTGIAEEHNQILSNCGQNDRQNVACYASSQQTAFDRSSAVAKLWAGSLQCTAWRIGAGNRFLTNNHCMSMDSTASESELWFNYQNSSCSSGDVLPVTKVPVKRILKTNYTLDYTLFEVDNFDAIKSFGYLGIDLAPLGLADQIYIPQHADGDPKQLAIFSDQNRSGLCEIDSTSTRGNGPDTDFGYYCDTLGGSSGSPVLNAESDKVNGLHHFGGCVNKAVKISRIWPEIAEFFHDRVPADDDGARLNNKLPTLDFSYTSNGLTATINNLSSDSDGQIVSQRWSINGELMSEDNAPDLLFLQSGSYPLKLSVVDNDAAPAFIEKSITVLERNQRNHIMLGNHSSLDLDTSFNDDVFVITVEPGELNLSVLLETRAATTFYVQKDRIPSANDYLCRAVARAELKECLMKDVSPGQYYITVDQLDSEEIRFSAHVVGNTDKLVKRWSNLESDDDEWRIFAVDVPAGMSTLKIETSDGQGDLDLYIQRESLPDQDFWSCASDEWGSDEECLITNPIAGTWYIGLYGRWDYRDVNLEVQAVP